MLYTEYYEKKNIPSDACEMRREFAGKKLTSKYKLTFPEGKKYQDYNVLEKIIYVFYKDKIEK